MSEVIILIIIINLRCSLSNKCNMRNSISSTQMADICLEDSYNASKEDIQIALAPDIQAYLTESSKRHSCCSVILPVAFERAEPQSWFDPKFDSPVLEEQFRTSVYPQIRLRFRFALAYILFCSLTWFIYFMCDNKLTEVLRGTICISLTLIFISCSIGLWLTYTKYYRLYSYFISSTIAIAISITSLCFLGFAFNSFSLLGHFALCIEIVFIIYTVIPLPLWQCSTITIIYSIMFEILTYFLQQQSNSNDNFHVKLIVIRVLLQLCIHIIGAHVLIMNVVRMRGTFMKVGQNLLVRRQLEMEKQLKEKMIHSVMPPKVADMLLKESNTTNYAGKSKYDKPKKSHELNLKSNDVKSLFRPFHMHSMNNVSILFADIVGFTKMSSTKTAEQLVEILNDLFERFDDLCELNGCEKISTLGDCYYCVSGCPEPRPDHAICCVEMGLGMIKTMQDFDAQRHEGVKIRVGVHTGTVLCGIVGTRRVKFDVWSNDVSLANKMESTGRPEQVHISQETSNFLSDTYILEEGEEVFGHRTYFVAGKKKESPKTSSLCIQETSSEKISQSTLALPELSVPPTSPVGHMQTAHSAGSSPMMSLRPRLASLGKVSKFLSSKKTESKAIMQQPKIIITAKSLPGSLNEDNNDDSTIITIPIPTLNNKHNEVIANHKNTSFFKNFNKFLRKPSMAHEINTHGHDKSPGEAEQNGYCQLPVVIETNNKLTSRNNSGNMLTVPNPIIITTSPKENHHNSNHSNYDGLLSPSGGGQFSMFDDIIDVRSYISQSRSDISPFGRTGSYRSHCGRSPNYDDITTQRPRSSTITSQLLQIDNNNENGNQRSLIERCNGDGLSVCPSIVGSRKDSGIRSNSRRSSIQQQIFQLNQTTHNRVSGYFTSSQSSLANIPHHVNIEMLKNPYPDPLAACLQQFRKQSDLQLIKCVRDNAKSQRNYLVKPPISKITLFFKSRIMEKEFRSKAHRLGGRHNNDLNGNGLPTLATPKYNTFLDILVGILFYFSITVSLFLLIQSTYEFSYRIWVGIFVIFTFFNCFVLTICSRQVCKKTKPRSNSISNHNYNVSSGSSNKNNDNYNTVIDSISGWYIWNFFGAIFLMLPTVSVLVNYMLQNYEKFKHLEYYYGFLLFICIIHFCNFTQLNCWMRNILSLISATLFLAITIQTHNAENVTRMRQGGGVDGGGIYVSDKNVNSSTILRDSNSDSSLSNLWYDNYRIEICLDLLLILLLIWFLNREFEIGYRLTFYGSAVANQDKSRVENMKNQADMLLHNIIPKYVADQLKSTAKYSENHQNIGIIFASIVNFNELYDESYLGGKEYLRVLNELIGDFDELLSRDEFLCVEKIKTIGSTFMAASGLDKTYRGDNYEHLHALLEFAISMQTVVEAFNKDLIEFNLILRIGYNIGDVTAGVIGTSKLYYDIWGDAVNVASRMDSTGVPGRLQVGKDCLKFLEMKYNFEARGKVYVKGKDDMEVYLYKDRKPDLPGDDDLMNGY